MKFRNINYFYAIIFLLLTVGAPGLKKLGIEHHTPKRKKLSDVMDDDKDFKFNKNIDMSNTRSLNAKCDRDLKYWTFGEEELLDHEKRTILAKVVQIATIVLMTTHAYSFAGKIFIQ